MAKKTSREATIEAIREFFRVVILAVVPIAVVMLEDGEWNWTLVGTTAAIAALRAIDSKLHNDPATELSGLSPV